MTADTSELFAGHRVATCRSVDDASEALSDVFLPVEIASARNAPAVGMELNALEVGRLTVGHMRFAEAVHIRTAEPENYHIDIPTHSRATMRADHGQRVHGTDQTAGVFMPGQPVELDCGERFAQIALMIPRSELQTELEKLLDGTVARPVEFESGFDLATPGGRAMLQAVRFVDEASRQADGPLTHPLAVRNLEQIILHSVLLAQPHNHTEALAAPRRPSGTRSVSRAVELLRSDLARPWTVGELASDACTSVRSLQEGFRRSLDTTPMAYLRRLRLERVREDLVTGAPGTIRVSDVAARWGFLHLGRFAAAYAARFGERPSETVRDR
jgi:AraC-like DNA-binding protein